MRSIIRRPMSHKIGPSQVQYIHNDNHRNASKSHVVVVS